MSSFAISLLASAVLATGGNMIPDPAVNKPQDVSLRIVADGSTLAGISFGLNAVDEQARLFDQKASTRVATGVRTIWYSCPDEPEMAGGTRVTVDFAPDTKYELVCRSGQPAVVRPVDEC